MPITHFLLQASINLKYGDQEYHCTCMPTQDQSGVVRWCQLWQCFLPAPRAPDTIFSANADAVDNRGKGPGLSTLSSKCTHYYFLSTLLLCFHLWNIGQCGWRGFPVSGPSLTMTGALEDGQQWTQMYFSLHTLPSFIFIQAEYSGLIIVMKYMRFAANHSHRINFIN